MNKLLKLLAVFSMVFLLFGSIGVEKAEASSNVRYFTTSICNNNGADTRSATTVWYYKVENGKTYRRLYDATNGKWLTDWILCE